MNQYTQGNQKVNRVTRGAAAGKPWALSLTLKCSIMLAVIFGAFVTRLHLNEKTEKLNAEAVSIRRQLHEKGLEIQNLKNKYSELCAWSNIRAKIKEYKLDLRSAEYSQIKYMKRKHNLPALEQERSYASLAPSAADKFGSN